MNKSSISEQLKHDYPDYKIFLDSNSRVIVANNYKMNLLNTSSDLETMNIFSRYGKNFYQAITQLLCSHYDVLPAIGSYASTLIILKEDLNKYKIQKLAQEWGIGFLETNEDVLAVKVEDGIERDLLLESPEVIEELFEEKYLPENNETLHYLSKASEEEDWAELVEINFDDEMEYLEKGIEFATAMEEVELKGEDIEDLEIIEEKIDKIELISNKKGFLNSILKILKL